MWWKRFKYLFDNPLKGIIWWLLIVLTMNAAGIMDIETNCKPCVNWIDKLIERIPAFSAQAASVEPKPLNIREPALLVVRFNLP